MAATDDRQARLSLDAIVAFEARGREAAFLLLTVYSLHLHPENAATALINKLFAVTALLPVLCDLLRIQEPFPLVTSEQSETLSQHFTSCQPVLETIEAGAREAAKCILQSSSFSLVPSARDKSFPIHMLNSAEEKLNACFQDLIALITFARSKHLGASGCL